MIATNTKSNVPLPLVIEAPLSPIKVSRSNPASDAKKRDREVPYGMKGGEH